MKVIVLGAAAGGGFPQWNSNAEGCRSARAGDGRAVPRTQTSIAVSADGKHWYILNASPDLREQIGRTPALHPSDGLRSSPIAGVILTGGDVDAIAGLLSLRERHPFSLYATAEVQDVLEANPIFEVLSRDAVARITVDPDCWFDLEGGPSISLFPVPGKVPLYMEEKGSSPPIKADGTTVGAMISNGDRRVAFIPSCAGMSPDLAERLDGVDVVFFDGTLWRDDEMILSGAGTKTGLRMGHMSMSGENGAMAAFRGLDVGRKVVIHINNSNPILLEDSPERAQAEAAGWLIAYDGLELDL